MFIQFMLWSLLLVAGHQLQTDAGPIFAPLTLTTPTIGGQDSKPPTKPPDGQTKPPTKPPDGSTPTGGGPIYGEKPTDVPSFAPSESCNLECKEDSDCPRICVKKYPFDVGTCVQDLNLRPTMSPSDKPTFGQKECPCDSPKNIPTKCEVDILIDMMDIAVSNRKLLGQWVRAAFHDAGTFDQTMPEGGANGCLLNEPNMR